VKEVTQDKKLQEQRLVNQLRNMMFKSFTHEIKTPLNGVIQSMDLAESLMRALRHKINKEGKKFEEHEKVTKLMS